MLRTVKVPVHDLNPHLTCVLCGGYYIDATTIIECLHSFCKSCIVRYLESSKFCPICDVQVHKTRPMENIRPDETLQDLVYKLVPGLFTREMKKRREFYTSNPAIPSTSSASTDSGSDAISDRSGRMEEDKISISIEFSPDGLPLSYGKKRKQRDNIKEPRLQKRYLLCPAAFTIGLLKKFLRMKLDLVSKYEIDVFHRQETLSDNYTLMDIAYIYTWRRGGPFRLFYAVFEPGVEPPPKKAKLTKAIKTEPGCDKEDKDATYQDPVCDNKTKPHNTSRVKTASTGSKKRGRPKSPREDKPPSKKKKSSASVRQTVSYLLNCTSKKTGSTLEPVSSQNVTTAPPPPKPNTSSHHQTAAPATITSLPVSLPLPPCLAKSPDSSDTTSVVPLANLEGHPSGKPGQPQPRKVPTKDGVSTHVNKTGNKQRVSNKIPGTGLQQTQRTIIKVPTANLISKTGTAPPGGRPDSQVPTVLNKSPPLSSVAKPTDSQQPTAMSISSYSVPRPPSVAQPPKTDKQKPISSKPIKESARQKKVAAKKPLVPVAKIKISALMQSKGIEQLPVSSLEPPRKVQTTNDGNALAKNNSGEKLTKETVDTPIEQPVKKQLGKQKQGQTPTGSNDPVAPSNHTISKPSDTPTKKEQSKKTRVHKAKQPVSAKIVQVQTADSDELKQVPPPVPANTGPRKQPNKEQNKKQQTDKGKPKATPSKTTTKGGADAQNKLTTDKKDKCMSSSSQSRTRNKEGPSKQKQTDKQKQSVPSSQSEVTAQEQQNKTAEHKQTGSASNEKDTRGIEKSNNTPADESQTGSVDTKIEGAINLKTANAKTIIASSTKTSNKSVKDASSRSAIVLKRPPPLQEQKKATTKLVSDSVKQTEPCNTPQDSTGKAVGQSSLASAPSANICATDTKTVPDKPALISSEEQSKNTSQSKNTKSSSSSQSKSESSDGKPKPFDGKPKPVDGKPKPVDGKPKSIDGKPKPVDGKPKPVDGKPKPVDGKPKSADGKPKTVDGKSKPADGKPKPVDSKPKPVLVNGLKEAGPTDEDATARGTDNAKAKVSSNKLSKTTPESKDSPRTTCTNGDTPTSNHKDDSVDNNIPRSHTNPDKTDCHTVTSSSKTTLPDAVEEGRPRATEEQKLPSKGVLTNGTAKEKRTT